MNLRYGDTAVQSTAQAYIFGCGNCHPLDPAKHRNGTVDVELFDAAAPPGSLKAMNPSNASYDPVAKICASVYCHSGYTVTSDAVGLPLTYPANPVPPGYMLNTSARRVTYIMDETCSNLTYDPFAVITARDYKITPAWGTTGTFTTCTECHAFPLTTYYPAVSAGAGDSHQWVNEIGYNYGHAYNMYSNFYGIPCATCHYTSVDHRGGVPPVYPLTANPPTQWVQDSNGNWIVAYYPVPVKDRSIHVNGASDVAFDIQNGYRYYAENWADIPLSLASATYNAQTMTCTNVSCHFDGAKRWQQNVRWGSPYRGWEGPQAECDVCHRYGNLNPTCQPAQ
jgi:predicted CxxxxCH...CXXCH cytochrome family protein